MIWNFSVGGDGSWAFYQSYWRIIWETQSCCRVCGHCFTCVLKTWECAINWIQLAACRLVVRKYGGVGVSDYNLVYCKVSDNRWSRSEEIYTIRCFSYHENDERMLLRLGLLLVKGLPLVRVGPEFMNWCKVTWIAPCLLKNGGSLKSISTMCMPKF